MSGVTPWRALSSKGVALARIPRWFFSFLIDCLSARLSSDWFWRLLPWNEAPRSFPMPRSALPTSVFLPAIIGDIDFNRFFHPLLRALSGFESLEVVTAKASCGACFPSKTEEAGWGS